MHEEQGHDSRTGGRFARFALVAGASSALGGCELIGDVFQAGVWVGVIIVVALIALVLWAVGKGRR
jgi:hypothetical protein